MANKQSSIKDIRQSRKRQERNVKERTRLKTLNKKVRSVASEGGEVAPIASALASSLDKAAKRNVIHKNKANRLKSRAARLANAKSAA